MDDESVDIPENMIVVDDINDEQALEENSNDEEEKEQPVQQQTFEIPVISSTPSPKGQKRPRKKPWLGFPTKDRPVPCGVCGREFTRADALKAHAAMHTGEKPFGCRVCGKRYLKARYLRDHKRMHTKADAVSGGDGGRGGGGGSGGGDGGGGSNSIPKDEKAGGNNRRFKCACDKTYSKSRYLRGHQKSCRVGAIADKVKPEAVKEDVK